MLLQALNSFYERATKEVSGGEPLIQNPAFMSKYIRWIIPLKADGTLEGIGLIENPPVKNDGRVFSVPRSGRAKNAGGVAEFLWDGLEAVFNLKPDPDMVEPNERRRASQDANREAKFADFWRQIEAARNDTKSPLIDAVLLFKEKHLAGTPVFLRWGSLEEESKLSWLVRTAGGSEEKYKTDNFTFQVDGQFLFEDEMLRNYWKGVYAAERGASETESEIGVCLVSGKTKVAISASHLPKIGGVPGAVATGAALISFDKESFRSYGLEKSYNSPISFGAVEGYTNALNFLLTSKRHRLKIGDTALVFWADKSEDVTDLFSALFEQPDDQTIKDFMTQPFRGDPNSYEFQEDQFYSVTLSGNAGRVVVRDWMQMTVRAAVNNFRKWFKHLQISPLRSHADDKLPPLNLFRLAASTVRDAKDLRPEVATQLYRSALSGHAPSLNLAGSIVRRIAVDLGKDGISSLNNLSRFSLLRLIVNRHEKENSLMIEPKLNDEIDDAAYNCGRLLAVFEELQAAAHDYRLEGASVVEKYYGTASASPNSAFGILWRLHQHHLRKVSRGNRGKAEAIKQKIAAISTHFHRRNEGAAPQFPRSFNLQAQGRFALGFYQQVAADREARDAYFKSKKTESGGESNNEQ
jgi:CRISPR-associated protein Csd1